MPLNVTEIFHSIQGESSHAGRPCAFVRLAGCNLRCAWCDTPYSWEGGTAMNLDAVVQAVARYGCPLVEVTGGEPLAQPETPRLVATLLDLGLEVLVETNGSLPISLLDRRASAIVDVKCPSSRMAERMDLDNLSRLGPRDEVKFVLAGRADFDYAVGLLDRIPLPGGQIHFSPVPGLLVPAELAAWILTENLAVRLALQLHKIIWNPGRRGV